MELFSPERIIPLSDCGVSLNLPVRVKIFTIPPIDPEPYKDETGPLRTSTLSMDAGLTVPNCAPISVAVLSLEPSIIMTTLSLVAPRILISDPQDESAVLYTPVISCMASLMLTGSRFIISSDVIIPIPPVVEVNGLGYPEALITISSESDVYSFSSLSCADSIPANKIKNAKNAR